MLSVHRWTGLTIGLLLLCSALSGMGLAFRAQLEPAAYTTLMTSTRCGQQAPLDLLVANAEAAYGGKAKYIRFFGDSSVAARVRFDDNDTLFVDRCSAKVLGEMNRYSGIFGSVEQFHTMRYWKIGSAFVASWALLYALIAIGFGIYLVWPMLRKRWRMALTLNRKLKRRAWSVNLHRTAALYASPIFLMTALTALPQGYELVETGLIGLDATPPAPPHDQRARPARAF